MITGGNMYKEIVYFGAELLNYWAMTFWGMKLFVNVYDIKVSSKRWIENILFALMCLPIALIGSIHYYYAIYSNSLTYIIVLYMCILVRILMRKNISVSLIAVYIFGMRLIDLWIVAVMKEISTVSRTVTLDLTHQGIQRCIFLVLLACIYTCVYNLCSKKIIIEYFVENIFTCRLLCIYSFIGIACFSTVYRFDYRDKLIDYWTIYLVCAFIIMGTFLYYFIHVKNKEKERMLNMRNNMMEANYQGLQKAYDANRMLQHDNKNHMLAMYELIKDNRNEEALNYINKWMNMSKNSLAGIRSGNEIIDIIVNSKVNEAKEKNIVFEYDVAHVGNLRIEDVDMCALLANLMDNAIEACEKIETNSWIHLSISRKNDMLLILIANSISKEMLKKKSFFETEKEKPHLHGWGMKSIERVIHKYDGEIVKTQKEDRLEIFITLPA